MGKRKVIFSIFLLLALAPLITAYELCEETVSEDKLKIKKIIYQEQLDETTWTWTSNQEVSVEVSVENKNFTERDFKIELFLLDEEDEIERNFMVDNADSTKTISLSESQSETMNFSFQLDEINNGNYFLYAKFFDEDNESICRSLKASSTGNEVTIEIEEEEKLIIVRNINGPTEVASGSTVEYEIEIINLGTIEEDRVLVIAYSANLGIREEKEIIGLNIEESKNVTFNLIIPEDAILQKEKLLFTTEYGYDNATGYYYESSDEEKGFFVQIGPPEAPIIETNQTENQTQAQPQTNQTIPQATPTENTDQVSEETGIQYFWTKVIAVILIIAIAAAIAISFYLKHKKETHAETPSSAHTLANIYVKKIRKETKPTRPNKPS